MITQVLDRASEIVRDEPFDMVSYRTCAVAALWRALGKPGPVDYPQDPRYLDLLVRVVEANDLTVHPDRVGHDYITAIHEGVWEQECEGVSAREATLALFATTAERAGERGRVCAVA